MIISVIIPALNEAGCIGGLIEALQAQQDVTLDIIVVDGGSADATPALAMAAGARVVDSAPGRGLQMNTGAGMACGELLLFLHADSRLTSDRQLADATAQLLASGPRTAGHFALQFETDDDEIHAALTFFEAKTALNRPGTFNGDQGLLIRRDDFELLRGFCTELGFLEDQEFGDRFRDYGTFITLPHLLITSGRRFEQEGVYERILLNTLIMAMYHLDLASFFREAPGIYRQHARTDRLDPGPFFELVNRCLFEDGFGRGVIRFWRTGRYATRNLWQPILWFGLRRGSPALWLSRYDRLIRPLTDNVLGYLIGTVLVIAWFQAMRFRLRRNFLARSP